MLAPCLLVLTAAVFAASAFADTCVAPPANIRSWLPGNSGSDLVGPNPGSLMNGATTGTGHVGNAFVLDGVNDYIDVPSSTGIKPTSAITVEAWVLLATTPPTAAGAAIVTKGVDGEVPDDWLLSITPGRKARPHIKRGATWHFFDGATTIPTGSWTHVAMTYDGSFVRVYVNGALDGQQAGSGAIQTSDFSMRVGAFAAVNGTVSQAWFPGSIDEVSVYDRALSASEIAAIAAAGTAGKCLPSVPSSTSKLLVALAAMLATAALVRATTRSGAS
jgi:hypothetical protein